MRKSRFSEAQTAEILKEGESGVPINDLIRKHGISRPTVSGNDVTFFRSSASGVNGRLSMTTSAVTPTTTTICASAIAVSAVRCVTRTGAVGGRAKVTTAVGERCKSSAAACSVH